MVHKEPLILLVITIFYSCDFLQLVVLYCVTLIYCCMIAAAVFTNLLPAIVVELVKYSFSW